MKETPIRVLYNKQPNITMVSNDFIDGPMCQADGEFVKIYLMILRLCAAGLPITTELLCDKLDLTHKDVSRAITYWEKAGYLHPVTGNRQEGDLPLPSVEDPEPADRDRKRGSSGQTAPASPDNGIVPERSIPHKKVLTPIELTQSKDRDDLGRTIFMAETYMGRPFSHSELNSLCYISDQLNFTAELMEYLIEYCVDRGKKSIHYIEHVALEWYRLGITTVSQAKEHSRRYARNVFPVMKALGLGSRNPAPAELTYINQWSSLGLPEEVILEACNRTLLKTHQPSFPYVNRILEDWSKKGVKNLKDIEELDRKHQEQKKNPAPSPKSGGRRNAFHNFEQRSYDFKDLESRLLGRDRR